MPLPPSPVIKGAYFRDLMAQPEVLRAAAAKLSGTSLDPDLADGLRTGRFRRVVLTGMGSSLHAAWPLHRALSHAGIASHWLETSELLTGFDSLIRPDTLLLAVSQSGESAEVASLMERAGEFGHVIGVTNNETSRLGLACTTRLGMEAGVESTVSCKTYLASLAVLHWLGAQLLRDGGGLIPPQIHQAAQAVREYLARWESHVDALLPMVRGIDSIFVTGRGDSLATAGTGGLILKEATRRPAEGMSSAAFRHGPLEMAGPNVLVLIFENGAATAPLQHRLVDDILRAGGKAILVGTSASGSAVFQLPLLTAGLQTLAEILPVQMLSLALAARDGVEAGRFERASKITHVS